MGLHASSLFRKAFVSDGAGRAPDPSKARPAGAPEGCANRHRGEVTHAGSGTGQPSREMTHAGLGHTPNTGRTKTLVGSSGSCRGATPCRSIALLAIGYRLLAAGFWLLAYALSCRLAVLPSCRLAVLLAPSVDNRGEKWGQVAHAVHKWHTAPAPKHESRLRTCPDSGSGSDSA